MKRIVQALLCLCLVVSARAQLMNVVSSSLTDSSNAPVSNATVTFSPVLPSGVPASYRKGTAGGQVIIKPVTATVTGGAFSINVADTATTNPVNICYAVTVTDNITGASLLGAGYSCLQPNPAASWCTGTTCNFDAYPPALLPQLPAVVGPTGATGPTGCVIGSTCTSALNPLSIIVGNSSTPGQVTIEQEVGSASLLTIGQVTSTNPKQLLLFSNPTSDNIVLQGIQQGVGFNQQLQLNPSGGGVSLNGVVNITGSGLFSSVDISAPDVASSGTHTMGYGLINTGIMNGAGLQVFRQVTTCVPTTGAALNTCTATVTLPVPEVDTSYYAVCTLNAQNAFVGSSLAQTISNFQVEIYTTSTAAEVNGFLSCFVAHN